MTDNVDNVKRKKISWKAINFVMAGTKINGKEGCQQMKSEDQQKLAEDSWASCQYTSVMMTVMLLSMETR